MYQQSGLGDKAAKEVADLASQFEGAVDDLMIVVVLAAVNNVLDGAGDAAAIGAVLTAIAAIIAVGTVVAVATVLTIVAGTTVVAAVSVAAGAVVAAISVAAGAAVAVGTVIAGTAVVAAAAIVLAGIAANAAGLAASVGGVSIEVEVIGEIFHLFVFVKILVLKAEVAAGSKNDDQSYDENADDKQSPILLLHDISPKNFFMPSYTGIIYRYQFTTN